MRPLVILAVIAGLGFGGYRLYEQRRATQLDAAFIYFICDTPFRTQAEPTLRAVSSLGIPGALPEVVKLAAWTRGNAPAEHVKAMTSRATPSRQEIAAAIARAVESVGLGCPARLAGLEPTGINAVLGSLIDALKDRPGAKGSNPGQGWVSWFSGFSISQPSRVSAAGVVIRVLGWVTDPIEGRRPWR